MMDAHDGGKPARVPAGAQPSPMSTSGGGLALSDHLGQALPQEC